MSQYGMQMAGTRARRGPTPDVYTALAAISTLIVLAACIAMWIAGSGVGKGGSAFGIQEAGKVELPQQK